ncbi:MAG: metallophosphoesterase family protein [Gaiellaceae bacterium]
MRSARSCAQAAPPRDGGCSSRSSGSGPIATLYDIHGNLAALEAVLAEVPDEATIVVGGDVCAGGEKPAETLERLRALGENVVWVRGNADRELTPGESGLAPPGALDATRAATGGRSTPGARAPAMGPDEASELFSTFDIAL